MLPGNNLVITRQSNCCQNLPLFTVFVTVAATVAVTVTVTVAVTHAYMYKRLQLHVLCDRIITL